MLEYLHASLITLTVWKRLHYTSKWLVFPSKLFKVVVIGAFIQKRQLNKTATDRPFLARIKNDVMINAYLIKTVLGHPTVQCICMCSWLSTNFSCINSFHARCFALQPYSKPLSIRSWIQLTTYILWTAHQSLFPNFSPWSSLWFACLLFVVYYNYVTIACCKGA